MGGVSKTISITQIMEALTKDTQDPMESGELDQVEYTLTDLEYEIGDGNNQVSYKEWLAIKSSPEFESLFDTSLSNRYSGYADDRRSQITGAINLLFASPATARATAMHSTATSSRAQIPAEVTIPPPPRFGPRDTVSTVP